MLAGKVIENAKKWVVIGVTTNKEKFGYKIYKRLQAIGVVVYGISPKYREIDGNVLYEKIEDLPDDIEVAVFVVNPKLGVDYVKKCAKKGIKTIWLQPGTVDFQVLQEAKRHNVEVIQSCVLVESKHMI